MSSRRQQLCEQLGDDGLLFADGFDRAIIGVMVRAAKQPIVLYDWDMCVAILIEENDSEHEEAVEHMNRTVTDSWVGEDTPGFLRKLEEDDDDCILCGAKLKWWREHTEQLDKNWQLAHDAFRKLRQVMLCERRMAESYKAALERILSRLEELQTEVAMEGSPETREDFEYSKGAQYVIDEAKQVGFVEGVDK